MVRVICVNAKNKPKRISPLEWITEGKIYTVVEVAKMNLQNNKFGYRLKEVHLSDQSFPYEYYSAERFGIVRGILEMEGEQKVYADELDLHI